jgi:hypothetical protein
MQMNIAEGKYGLDKILDVLRGEAIPHTTFDCLSNGLTDAHCSALETELNRQLEAFHKVKAYMKKAREEREYALQYSNTALREEWVADIDRLRRAYQKMVLDVKLDPALLRAQVTTVPAQFCWFTVEGLPFYASVDGEHLLGSVKMLALSDNLTMRDERGEASEKKAHYSQRLQEIQQENDGSKGTLFLERDFWNAPQTDGKVHFKMESIATGYIVRGSARRNLRVHPHYRRAAVEYAVHVHRVSSRGRFVGLDTALTVSHNKKVSRVYRLRLETNNGVCSVSVADEESGVNSEARAWNDPRKTMKEKHVINYIQNISRVLNMLTGKPIQGRQEKVLKKTVDKIIAYSQPKA